MAFLIDTFLLICLGTLLALIAKKRYKPESFLIYELSFITLALFYYMSLGLWLGYPMFGDFIDEDPTKFMYSGESMLLGFIGMTLPFNNWNELVKYPFWVGYGVIMFCTYPMWLFLGIKNGYRMFGRYPHQKGLMGLIK